MLSQKYLQTRGCCSAKNSKKCSFLLLLLYSHTAAIFNIHPVKNTLSGFTTCGVLLKACWIPPQKHAGFIPEILPVCRCVVSLQQQCFAKLQSEMNQLARPPACQPSHPAKTNDRGPLLFFHNSSYESSFFFTSHKYTHNQSEDGGTRPASSVVPFEGNDQKTFVGG